MEGNSRSLILENFRHLPGGTEKTTKNFRQDNRYSCRDLNPRIFGIRSKCFNHSASKFVRRRYRAESPISVSEKENRLSRSQRVTLLAGIPTCGLLSWLVSRLVKEFSYLSGIQTYLAINPQ